MLPGERGLHVAGLPWRQVREGGRVRRAAGGHHDVRDDADRDERDDAYDDPGGRAEPVDGGCEKSHDVPLALDLHPHDVLVGLDGLVPMTPQDGFIVPMCRCNKDPLILKLMTRS